VVLESPCRFWWVSIYWSDAKFMTCHKYFLTSC
jgi:hypothetical protein